MKPILPRMLIAVILLPIIIISGIYLRIKSRPYKKALFAVHKTLTVATHFFLNIFHLT